MTGKTNEPALWPKIIVLVALPLLALASSARSDPVFMGLGALEDSGESSPLAVSADGTVIVGAASLNQSTKAFRWSAETGMVALSDVANLHGYSYASGTSADGSVVVGAAPYLALGAFRWTTETGPVGLSDETSTFAGEVWPAVSDNGSVVVGRGSFDGSQPLAILWSAATGPVNLGALPGHTFSEAGDVSADGSVVVGTSTPGNGARAVLWTADNEPLSLGTLPGQSLSYAGLVSSSGDLVVGVSGSEVFSWTADTGLTGLGVEFSPKDMSGDGSIIVGRIFGETWSTAVVWDEMHSLRSLHDVLVTDYNLDLAGWTLGSAEGISADGSVITGWGDNPAGLREAWIAIVPEPGSLVFLLIGMCGLLARRQNLSTPRSALALITVIMLLGTSTSYAQRPWDRGPVLIGGDGMDRALRFDGHGQHYMREGFNFLARNICDDSRRLVVCIGCNGLATEDALRSFNLALDASELGDEWSRAVLQSVTDINNFFENTGDRTRIEEAGIIYMPSSANRWISHGEKPTGLVIGGITREQLEAVNEHKEQLKDFVDGGGGLYTHTLWGIEKYVTDPNPPEPEVYKWFYHLFPSIGVSDLPYITSDGSDDQYEDFYEILKLTCDAMTHFLTGLTDTEVELINTGVAPWPTYFFISSGDAGLGNAERRFCGLTEILKGWGVNPHDSTRRAIALAAPADVFSARPDDDGNGVPDICELVPETTGACCDPVAETCWHSTPSACVVDGGNYQGDSTACGLCSNGPAEMFSCGAICDSASTNAGDPCANSQDCTGGTCDQNAQCNNVCVDGGPKQGEPCTSSQDCSGSPCDTWGSYQCAINPPCSVGACCASPSGVCTVDNQIGCQTNCEEGNVCVFMGIGSNCDSNCCHQTYSGGDDCLGANGATVKNILVPAIGSPPVTVTITGSTAPATADGSNQECDPFQPGWWEAFHIDKCANVRIDFCCTEISGGPARPVWANLVNDCDVCGDLVMPNALESPIGEGVGGQATGRGGLYCDDDNPWMTFGPLAAGTYYYPIYTALGGTMAPSPAEYQLHITAAPCTIAACCVENTCLGNEPKTELECAAADGFWLSPPNVLAAQSECTPNPCLTGSCCTVPGTCSDENLGTPMNKSTCDDVTPVAGTFTGGVSCDNKMPPCPACTLNGAENCQGEVAQAAFQVDETQSILRADDFIPISDELSTVCVWGEYLRNGDSCAGVWDCFGCVTDDVFEVSIYDDDSGIPGALIGSSTTALVSDVKSEGVLTGATYLYQYELSLDAPISLVPGEWHWIEIVNTPVLCEQSSCPPILCDDPSTCSWYWVSSVAGVNNHSIGTETGIYGREGLISTDLSFCLDAGILVPDLQVSDPNDILEPGNHIRFVDDDASGTDKDGLSWDTAYSSLQDALTDARDARNRVTQIWVAAGTYKPDDGEGYTLLDRDASFELVNGVTMYGGFPDPDPGNQLEVCYLRDSSVNETILSGDIGGLLCPSYHVVQIENDAGNPAVLDGFTITGGGTVGGNDLNGAGIHITQASPVIKNCRISSNIADQLGGGVYSDGGNPTFLDCTFAENHAHDSGGGMWLSGGAATLKRCIFSLNLTLNKAGGLFLQSGSASLVDCDFRANSSVYSGGAIFNAGDNLTAVNCEFRDNTGWAGGAIRSTSTMDLVNCLFVENLAKEYLVGEPLNGLGGALFAESTGPTVTNCTFAGNKGTDGAAIWNEATSATTLRNCVLWGNVSNKGGVASGTGSLIIGEADVEYSCIQNDVYFIGLPNTFNIADCVLSPENYHLLPESRLSYPGVNEGNKEDLPSDAFDLDRDGDMLEVIPVDLDYAQRVVELFVDMGSYEEPGEFGAIHVDVNSTAGGLADGSDWDLAFDNLQDALAAAVAGDAIWVAEGIYHPSDCSPTCDRLATFALKNGVALYGGFVKDGGLVDRNLSAHRTILSGDLNDDDDDWQGGTDENSYHVVSAFGVGTTALLDGFEIVAGYADDANAPGGYGGGLYLSGSSPRVANCVVRANSANLGGAGIYSSGGDPTLANCIVNGNTTQGQGAGLYNANGNPALVGCTLSQNTAIGVGGGVYTDASTPTLKNCILWGNSDSTGTGQAAQLNVTTAIVTHSCIQDEVEDGIAYPGLGNIDTDPLFVDANGPDDVMGSEDDNFMISEGSPCLDVGENMDLEVWALTDAVSRIRTFDADLDQVVTVDMGAYEYTCPPMLPPDEDTELPAAGYGTNRYITFEPGNPGEQTALRITFAELPPAFDLYEGTQMWVKTPFEVSEASGVPGSGAPNFWAAILSCDPSEAHYRDWSTIGTLHVYGADIIPSLSASDLSVYEVQAIHQDCDSSEEVEFSAPLRVTMSIWGDVVGYCDLVSCSPPNGAVDFDDISATVDKFKNLPDTPKKSRADIVPANGLPDRKVDFDDINSVIDAFNSLPYPFTPLNPPCP